MPDRLNDGAAPGRGAGSQPPARIAPASLRRRAFLRWTGLAGAAALVAGCRTAPPAADSGPDWEMRRLEYAGYSLDEAHAHAFGLFKDVEPDIDLVVSPVHGSWHAMTAAIQARLTSGDAPDIAIVAPHGLSRTWGANGSLLNLSPFLQADFDAAGVPAAVMDLYRLDETAYGMPKEYATHAMMYNRDLFDAAGIAYPEAGWTWADCLAKAQALTRGAGPRQIHGLGTRTQPGAAEHWLWANRGPGFFDRWAGDFRTPTAADRRNKEALQWLVDTIYAQAVAPSPAQLRQEGSGSRQIRGRLAMWMGSTLDAGRLQQSQAPLNWHVAPLPRAFARGPAVTMLWSTGFGIVADTERAAEAFAFLKHMATGAGALTLGAAGYAVPAGRPEGFLTDAMQARGGAAFVDAAFQAHLAAGDSLGTNHDELLRRAVQPYFAAAFERRMDAATALDAIQQHMQLALAQVPTEQR